MRSKHFLLALKIVFLSSAFLMLAACGDGYGSMEDPRDGHKYKTLDMFGFSFMAENMKYNTGDSRCKDDDVTCEKYGRYYSPYSAPFVCPNGWKVFGDRNSFEMMLAAYISNKFDVPQDKNLKQNMRAMFQDEGGLKKVTKAFVTEVFSNTSCVYDVNEQKFDCGRQVCKSEDPTECVREYDGCLLVGEKVRCWNINDLNGDGKGKGYAAPIRCYKEMPRDSFEAIFN